jgi:hypothetical protein
MKKTVIIFFLFLFHFTSFSQDTLRNEVFKKKHPFSIRTGVSYKNFFGKKYIEIEPDYLYPRDESTHYDGFTKIPTIGFQAGILWTCTIYRNLHFSLGLFYYLRKDVYEGNTDTVMKYHTPSSIHKIIKYDYSFHNIELPVLLSYKLKKFNLSIGVNLALLNFDKARYSYIPDTNINNGVDSKTLTSIELPLKVFPTFQISYDLKINDFLISPFLGIEIGSKNAYYIQGGIIVPLVKCAK